MRRARRAASLLARRRRSLRRAPCAKPRAPPRPRRPRTYVFPRWPPGELRRRRSASARDAPGARCWPGRRAAAEKRYAEAAARAARELSRRETASPTRGCAAGRLDASVAAFAGVLERQPDYVPALVGARLGRARGAATRRARSRCYRRGRGADRRRRDVRAQAAAPSCGCRSRSGGWPRRARRSSAGDTRRGGRGSTGAPSRRRPEVTGVRLELAELLAERGRARGGASRVLEADPAGRPPGAAAPGPSC